MDMYDEILKSLETEDRVMLATIIATTGSTPASAHSKMMIREHGIISAGTVGGGCMEGDVVTSAHKLFAAGIADILTFQLNNDDIEHGLICGGSLDVLIEPITRRDIPMIRSLKLLRDAGKDSLLLSLLEPDKTISQKFVVDDQTAIQEIQKKIGAVPFDLQDVVQKTLHRQETRRIRFDDRELIVSRLPEAHR